MKIIKLEILNLASLDRQEGETINFEEGALKEATIFSIVGATGSGKSTILDAICLALYNRAPRYPRKKGERNQGIEIYGELEEEEKTRLPPTDARNILTRGKKEGFSKLTFRANNGIFYRAEWRVNKKSKKFGNAETSLYKISYNSGKQTEESADWETLPKIIGLDYDQFLRTVLIAQGSFSSFIKAKENERYELLEKLIGCEGLYSRIAFKIKEKKDEAVRKHTEIAAGLSAREQDIIADEELEVLNGQIEKLESKEKEVKEELLKTRDALAWYDLDEKFIENIKRYGDTLNTKKQNLEKSKKDAYLLQLHDTTLSAVDIYKDLKTAESNLSKGQEKLNSLCDKIAKKEEEIKHADEEELVELKLVAKAASEKMEQELPHIRKAREIKTELEGLKKTLEEKKNAKASGELAKSKADKELEDNRKAIEKYEASLKNCKNELDALNKELQKEEETLIQVLTASQTNLNDEKIRTKGLEAEVLQKDRSNAEKALADLKSAIKLQSDLKNKSGRKGELIKSQTQFTEENVKIREKLKGIDIESLSKDLDTLNKSYTLLTSENLEKLRHDLVDGKECPLCGSIHHPFIKEEERTSLFDEMKELIEKETKKLNELREEKESLSKKQAANDGKLEGIKEELKNLETEIASISKDWEEIHSEHENWQADVKILQGLQPELEKDFNDADKRLGDYNDLMKNIERLSVEKENAEGKKQRFEKLSLQKRQAVEKKIEEAKLLLETEKGKSSNLLSQQREKSEALEVVKEAFSKIKSETESKEESLKKEIGERDPDSLEKELAEAKTKADKAVADKIESVSRLREQLREMKGEENVLKTQQSNNEKTITEKKEELEEWLVKYNEGKSEQVMEETIDYFYRAPDNWEELRARLNNLNQEYTASETTLKNEQDAHKAHQDKKPECSRESLQIRKKELENHSNEELIEKKARIQRHEKAKEEMGAIFEFKKKAESYKNEWEEITRAIGSEGKTLRKIAQCHTLGFLIDHANYEIRKFNSRYELQQVKNSLGIRVIDHDRADDVRDTTSLSGGETFLVSLGLALGLSSLSSRNISFENLFIDEGFGTLDPDTLDTVIDSLAMLQTSQGKKVGVISHTDSMSERISTQIRIIKHGNSGSSHIEIHP